MQRREFLASVAVLPVASMMGIETPAVDPLFERAYRIHEWIADTMVRVIPRVVSLDSPLRIQPFQGGGGLLSVVRSDIPMSCYGSERMEEWYGPGAVAEVRIFLDHLDKPELLVLKEPDFMPLVSVIGRSSHNNGGRGLQFTQKCGCVETWWDKPLFPDEPWFVYDEQMCGPHAIRRTARVLKARSLELAKKLSPTNEHLAMIAEMEGSEV